MNSGDNMKESFNKFKKKIILEVLIKCLVFSFSLGLIAFSLPLLIIKIMKIQFNILYLVLIGLGVFILMFGFLFLLLKPNNKKVAKKIDKDLDLKEKVQTMIEFEHEEGMMIELQRENTISILSNTSIKKLSMRFGVFFFTFVILAMSLCVTAFAIPGYKEEVKETENEQEEIVDPNYELEKYEILKIKEIIEKVEKSSINSSLKSKYVSKLYELIDQLEIVEKESEMKETVLGVISYVQVELDKVNTNNEIYGVLKVSDYGTVVTIATQINALDIEQLGNAIDGIEIAISGVYAAIAELDVSFGRILKASKLDKTDELYIALIKLVDDLNAVKSTSDVTTEVKSVVDNNIDNILAAAQKQKDNKDIADYIEHELTILFRLNEDSNTEGNGSGNGSGSNGNGNEGNEIVDNTGGLGKGEELFGSNDSFYDPESGKVVYGDVIAKYFGDILGKLDEGVIPEELREYFDYYYNILYGDLEDME